MARPIVWPLGKSAFFVSPPCQVIVQPPACMAMLSAPGPATNTRAPLRIGNVPALFFNRTSDLEAASRANSKCAAAPTIEASPRAVWTSPINPNLYLTRKIRRTASSSRAADIVPFLAACNVEVNNIRQLSGAMNRSSPALIAAAQSVAVQPGI